MYDILVNAHACNMLEDVSQSYLLASSPTSLVLPLAILSTATAASDVPMHGPQKPSGISKHGLGCHYANQPRATLLEGALLGD
jgi:hypothetical protein